MDNTPTQIHHASSMVIVPRVTTVNWNGRTAAAKANQLPAAIEWKRRRNITQVGTRTSFLVNSAPLSTWALSEGTLLLRKPVGQSVIDQFGSLIYSEKRDKPAKSWPL